MTAPQRPPFVRVWTDVVRRARLGRTVTGGALVLATYAGPDGEDVFPGVAVLAVAYEVSYKTAKSILAELLEAGLLELVERRRGRRGYYSVYRLTLAEDLLDRVQVLSPAEFELAAERLRQANRRKTGTGNPATRTNNEVRGTPRPVPPVENPEVRGTPNPVPPVDNPEVQGTPRPVPAEEYGEPRSPQTPEYGERDDRSTGNRVPQEISKDVSISTSPTHITSRTEGDVTAREDPQPEEPLPPQLAPALCPHGLRNHRRGGLPACPFCRRALPADAEEPPSPGLHLVRDTA